MSSERNHPFRSNTMAAMLVNALLFQAIWWICMMGMPDFAAIFLIALIVHYMLTTLHLKTDALVAGSVFLTGVLFDVLWKKIGVYTMTSDIPSEWLPIWIILIWAGFALTVRRSLLKFLKKKWSLVLLCVTLGPFTYVVMAQIGKLNLSPFAVFWMAGQWLTVSLVAIWVQYRQSIVRTLSI